MALSALQVTRLNKLQDTIPSLMKGKLPEAEQILLGDLLAGITIAEIATADPATVVTADADGTYGAPEASLINELKATVNVLVTLATEIKDAINATL